MHVTTCDSYLVRRVKRDSTITADWVKTAKILNEVVGSSVTAAKLISKATAGIATEVMILTVVVDIVTGMIIDFFIEKLGTVSQQYFDWLIVVRR